MDGTVPGGRVVVYDEDGTYLGNIIAELLKSAGADVTLVTPASEIAPYLALTMEQEIVAARMIELEIPVIRLKSMSRIACGHVVLDCVHGGEGLDLQASSRRACDVARARRLALQGSPRDSAGGGLDLENRRLRCATSDRRRSPRRTQLGTCPGQSIREDAAAPAPSMTFEEGASSMNMRPVGERGAFRTNHLESLTLPSRYYTDDAIYRRELHAVHYRSWCYVGHVSDIPRPRDYFTDIIAGQPIFVMRDRNSEIRAFFNVCQHRGHELLKGRGSLKVGIACPYHAWFYNLDGTLRNAPHTETVANFDRAQFSLRAVNVAQSAGLLFVQSRSRL